MPNPNYSELRLLANYGEDADNNDHMQGTRVYPAVSDDSDEIDHKFVYQAALGGTYVELAHYTSAKMVVVQNLTTFPGVVFHIDNTTGAFIPDLLTAPVTGASRERVTFCDPDVTAGIMLYSIAVEEMTDWHIVIIGRKD